MAKRVAEEKLARERHPDFLGASAGASPPAVAGAGAFGLGVDGAGVSGSGGAGIGDLGDGLGCSTASKVKLLPFDYVQPP